MNIKIYLKTLVWGTLAFSTITSCVKSDDYSIPPINCNSKFAAPNHKLSDLATLGKITPAQSDIIASDYIVEGYVSSSDESGNIYKQLFIQDDPANPTQGIEMDIDGANNYINYPIGAKVRINAKGLIVQAQNGNVKLGAYDPNYAVGRINPNLLANYMSRVCGTDGYAISAKMVPVVFASFSDAMKAQNINKLIKVNNVQYKADATGMGSTDATSNVFADPLSASGASDRYMTDVTNTSFDVRNSSYANFAKTLMRPTYAGSGSVTLILSLYTSAGGSQTWQGYLRDLNDLQLTNAAYTLNIIDFQSFAVGATTLTPMSNVSVVGTKKWTIATFSSNNYAYFNGFGAGNVKSDLAVPITFNGKNTLSFKTNAGYYNGDVLKVYWSTNYNPTNPSAATLNDITSMFDISKGKQPPSGTGSNYETTFRSSGVGTLPTTATGAGYIIFEYGTSGTITTAMELDDIIFM